VRRCLWAKGADLGWLRRTAPGANRGLARPLAPCPDARLTQGFRNLRAPVTEPHRFQVV